VLTKIHICLLNVVTTFRIDWARESAKARAAALGLSRMSSSAGLIPNEFALLESERRISMGAMPSEVSTTETY